MCEKTEKIKNSAEKSGEAIGAGVKKSVNAVTDFAKGIKEGIKKEE